MWGTVAAMLRATTAAVAGTAAVVAGPVEVYNLFGNRGSAGAARTLASRSCSMASGGAGAA